MAKMLQGTHPSSYFHDLKAKKPEIDLLLGIYATGLIEKSTPVLLFED